MATLRDRRPVVLCSAAAHAAAGGDVGRHARAVSQPRRNLVLLGVLAEGGD